MAGDSVRIFSAEQLRPPELGGFANGSVMPANVLRFCLGVEQLE